METKKISEKLKNDLRSFFLSCEVSKFVKYEDMLVYTVNPVYIENTVKRANEIIKIKGLDLIAKRAANPGNTFTVEKAI